MIYFDNAATTKDKPKEVIEAVVYALQNFGNSSRGIYSESLSADRMIYDTRKQLAKLFHAGNARQVVFTKNSTESLNVAIQGLLESGDHVITSVMEHNSVLRPLNYFKKKGVTVSYLGVDERGVLQWSNLQDLILPNTRAVILTHASNVTGNINPIEEIGAICRERNILFIVDASQTAGAFEIDMERAKIDVLCFTGHKSLLAPQGVGGMCVGKDVYIRPLMSGGTGTHTYDEFQVDAMPTRLEAGTLNSHGIAGLHAALGYIASHTECVSIEREEGISNEDFTGMDAVLKKDLRLDSIFRDFGHVLQDASTAGEWRWNALTGKALRVAKYFYDAVMEIKGIRIYGDFTSWYRSPIISLNIGDLDSSYVSDVLSTEYQIATRPGAHCAPRMHRAMGTVNQGMVRFSFSHKNTYEEIDIAIMALKEIGARNG